MLRDERGPIAASRMGPRSSRLWRSFGSRVRAPAERKPDDIFSSGGTASDDPFAYGPSPSVSPAPRRIQSVSSSSPGGSYGRGRAQEEQAESSVKTPQLVELVLPADPDPGRQESRSSGRPVGKSVAGNEQVVSAKALFGIRSDADRSHVPLPSRMLAAPPRKVVKPVDPDARREFFDARRKSFLDKLHSADSSAELVPSGKTPPPTAVQLDTGGKAKAVLLPGDTSARSGSGRKIAPTAWAQSQKKLVPEEKMQFEDLLNKPDPLWLGLGTNLGVADCGSKASLVAQRMKILRPTWLEPRLVLENPKMNQCYLNITRVVATANQFMYAVVFE